METSLLLRLAGVSQRKVHGGIKLVDNLKVRVSWGITGNDRIPRNVWEQTYNPNQDYVLGNDITAVGVAMTSLANPFIRWE
jgi:hypothetical protein